MMDDISYYSDDDESVCVGLTFTPAVHNKLAQSSTNSTDSGVECADQRSALECSNGSVVECAGQDLESCGVGNIGGSVRENVGRSLVELSNTCDSDTNVKCETDSGCDVKPTPENLDEIYPGLSDAKLLDARKKNLGGVKGGKVAALNARSLDILNGKFDEPSRKFALRPNPRAVEDSPRKDKRPCNKTPPSNLRRNQSSGIIYENVSTPSHNPVYVNYRPSKYQTPVKPRHCSNLELSSVQSPEYLSPMTAAKIAPTERKRCEAVLYNTPVKRSNQSRYSSRAPPKEVISSPHHYELIVSPDSSFSSHTTTHNTTLYNTSSIAPRDPPRPLDCPADINTISSKSASPSFLSPGEVAGSWGEGDSTIDKSIKSYHEAVRSSNRIPCSSLDVRCSSPSLENPLYSNTKPKAPRLPATRGSPTRGARTDIIPQNRGRSPVNRGRSPVRGRQYVNAGGDTIDQYRNVYNQYQNVYDRYTPPELQQMQKKSGRHYSVDSSPGRSTSTGSLSDTEYNRPAPSKRPSRPTYSRPRPSQPPSQPALSRFRYSTSNLHRPATPLSEDEQRDTKRGVVLIQATLEDVHSLYKVDDEIFELRFSDSGLTSDLIHLLGDLCNEKNIVRLIFEDCELDDWVLLSKVINQTRIYHLGFHSCTVGDEGTARISQLLTSTASIASLDLVDCKVGCAGIAALGVALMQNTSLKSLNLSKNPFLPKGAVLFFRALKGGNSTLQFLSLANTCSGNVQVIMMICALLLRNTVLSHLNLNNTGLSDDGVTLISESLAHNSNLTSLCMSSNGLEDGSAHEIAVTLADKNSIQHIDLSCNNMTQTGMHVLIQSSTVQGQMRRLDLTSNKITPRQYMVLVKAVEDLALVGVVVF
ncbi:hypothetical protein ACHWQZ_G002316 [Mnemiopsis leidyi]